MFAHTLTHLTADILAATSFSYTQTCGKAEMEKNGAEEAQNISSEIDSTHYMEFFCLNTFTREMDNVCNP